MAPHSSTLAWKIPWTEDPGGPQSMGSLRVGHNWATSLSLFTFMHWRRKWQPTPVFLPGESQGQGEPGGLPSMGSHRVRHDWSDLAAVAVAETTWCPGTLARLSTWGLLAEKESDSLRNSCVESIITLPSQWVSTEEATDQCLSICHADAHSLV